MKLTNVVDNYTDFGIRFIEKKPWIFILFIISINLILKGYYLSVTSLFLDEASQIMMSLMNFKETIEYSLLYPNAPVYTLILNGWIKLFGISETATRWLSVILSSLTIPVIFFLCRRFLNITCAIISILVFSVSNLHMYYSHEVRSYALVSLLVTTSFYFFLSIQEKENWKKLSVYTLINTILLYTHLTSILIIPIQFIGVLINIKSKPKIFIRIIISQMISVGLLSIWFLSNKWFGGSETTWLAKPDLQAFFHMYFSFFNRNFGSTAVVISVIIFIIFYFKHNKNERPVKPFKMKTILLLLWAIFPVITMFLLSVFYNPRFIPRYMLYASIGTYICLSYLLSSKVLPNWVRWLLVFMFLLGSLARLELNPGKGEDWKAAMNYYKSVRTQNSYTVVSAWYQHLSFSYYYDKDIFKDYNKTLKRLSTKNISFVDKAGILDLIHPDDYEKIILILSHNQVVDPEKTLIKSFTERFQVIDTKKFDGIEVMVFDTSY